MMSGYLAVNEAFKIAKSQNGVLREMLSSRNEQRVATVVAMPANATSKDEKTSGNK